MTGRAIAIAALLWASLGCRDREAPAPVRKPGDPPVFRVEDPGAAPPGPQPGDPERPNVLLVVIESLDAQTVLDLRDDPSGAPTLARLMDEGVYFEQAFTQGGWTLPGLAALLTGRYPRLSHEGTTAGALDAPGYHTLPEVLGTYGYTTGAIWGGTLACSFTATLSLHASSPPRCGRSAFSYEHAFEVWVAEHAREPWFLLLHNIDLHAPEPAAPVEWLHRYVEPHEACPGAGTGFVYEHIEPAMGARAAAEHVLGHYRGQLAWYDQALGRMLQTLEESGQLEDTVVVLTTNHGQDLFEHACFDHGVLYDTVLHIPMLWWESGIEPGRVDRVVQIMDLTPSILDRLDIPYASLDGRSLLPLLGLSEGRYQEREVFSLSRETHASLRTRELKLILGATAPALRCEAVRTPPPPLGSLPHLELYDLVADPGERNDLYARRADEVAPMVQALLGWLEARRPGEGEDLPPILDHQREALQERGYWELGRPEGEDAPPLPHAPPHPIPMRAKAPPPR